MTPEAQRIAIAKACGWTKITLRNLSHGDTPDFDWSGCDNGSFANTWLLPNYPTDLNAMHEAEKMLTDDNFGTAKTYETLLARIMPGPRGLWNATSAQRAKAFLKTIGKWEE